MPTSAPTRAASSPAAFTTAPVRMRPAVVSTAVTAPSRTSTSMTVVPTRISAPCSEARRASAPHEQRRRDERLARAVQPGDERPAEMRLEPAHVLARDDVGRYAGCAQPAGQKLALCQLLLAVDQAQATGLVVFDLLGERLRQLDEQLEPLRHQPHVALRVLRHVAGEVHRRPSGRCSRRARGQLIALDEHDLPSSERQVVGDRGPGETAADDDDVGLPCLGGAVVMPARVGGHFKRRAMFMSLDFLYVPTADVDLAVDSAVEVLGAELVWKIRAMGTTVDVPAGNRGLGPRCCCPATSRVRRRFSCTA